MIKHRQRGTLVSTNETVTDYGPMQVLLVIAVEDGGEQTFGGLPVNVEAWKRELCEVFGVTWFGDIPGKECWVLRAFAEYNEPIEGLEASNGKRFTKTGYARRHGKDPLYPNRLHCRVAEVVDEISRLERRISEQRQVLEGITKRYVEWTEEPKP